MNILHQQFALTIRKPEPSQPTGREPSIYGCTTIASPTVARPKTPPKMTEGLRRIADMQAKGLRFEEAYAQVWQDEVRPPKPQEEPRIRKPKLEIPSHAEVYAERRKLAIARMQSGEASATDLRHAMGAGEKAAISMMADLISDGTCMMRKFGRAHLYRLAGHETDRGNRPLPNNAKKLKWRGVEYASMSHAAEAEGVSLRKLRYMLKERAPAPRQASGAITMPKTGQTTSGGALRGGKRQAEGKA